MCVVFDVGGSLIIIKLKHENLEINIRGAWRGMTMRCGGYPVVMLGLDCREI